MPPFKECIPCRAVLGFHFVLGYTYIPKPQKHVNNSPTPVLIAIKPITSHTFGVQVLLSEEENAAPAEVQSLQDTNEPQKAKFLKLLVSNTLIRWILKILHDLKYLIHWELRYYSILRSCRIF